MEDPYRKAVETVSRLNPEDITAGHVMVTFAIGRAIKKIDEMPRENRTSTAVIDEIDVQSSLVLMQYQASEGTQQMTAELLAALKDSMARGL